LAQLPASLSSLWRWWAERTNALQTEQLAAPTRCAPWTVQNLLVHAAPDRDRLATVLANPIDADDAVADAAVVLRAFNAPGGVAHVMADEIASAAAAAGAQLSKDDVARSFQEAVALVEGIAFEPATRLPYPVVGAVTAAALTQIAIVEGTVHGLDLAAAVGGDLPPAEALACTLDILVRIPDAAVLIDALTGRGEAAAVLPVMR
jgi:hypothetical protein